MTLQQRPQIRQNFSIWEAYFERNLRRHDRLDAEIPWQSEPSLSAADRAAIAHSLQRFELGESGEGAGLRSKASRRNDAGYDAALVRFIAEEQKHSALFARVLERFGAPRLKAHWSDSAFVVLRRMLGLRTEVTLFLIAETVAMEYFGALSRCADPVVRGVARRVVTDEVEHIRFQIDQLRAGFEGTPGGIRMLAAGFAWAVAIAAATVVAIDHRHAMEVCGLSPRRFFRLALGHFSRAVAPAFRLGGEGTPFGPSVLDSEFYSGGAS